VKNFTKEEEKKKLIEYFWYDKIKSKNKIKIKIKVKEFVSKINSSFIPLYFENLPYIEYDLNDEKELFFNKVFELIAKNLFLFSFIDYLFNTEMFGLEIEKYENFKEYIDKNYLKNEKSINLKNCETNNELIEKFEFDLLIV